MRRPLTFGSLKAFTFMMALMALSLKGEQSADVGAVVASLPGWLIAIKNLAIPTAALSLAIYIVVSLGRARRIRVALLPAAYALVLAAYYLRSALLGSDSLNNILAVFILFGACMGIAADSSDPARHSEFRWYAAIEKFFPIFTVTSLLLLISGYGQQGARFSGLTYHPNAEGFLAALGSGFFMLRFSLNSSRGWERSWRTAMLLISLMLVVASGSRSAALMVTVAMLLVFPVRRALAALGAIGLATGVFLASDTSIGVFLRGAVDRMINAPLDNREGVWHVLLADFLSHPFSGVGDTSGVSGSAPLTAFAGTGMFGGGVFLVTMFVACFLSMRVIISHRNQGASGPYLVTATLCIMIAVGGLFEANLFDKFGPTPMLMLAMLGVIARAGKVATKHVESTSEPTPIAAAFLE